MNDVLPYHDKDLSMLPAPEVLETINYDDLLAQRSAVLNGLNPLVLDENKLPVSVAAELIQSDNGNYWKIPAGDYAGLFYVDLNSDSAVRVVQADVYREMLLRQRVNNAALSTMPAFAKGADLDHLGSRNGVFRLVVSQATETTAAIYETDAAYLKRILLVVEGYARGGSLGWYLFNALSASGQVKDIRVYSPEPCEIIVVVLGRDGDGTPSQELINTVDEYIKTRENRVLGDLVTVIGADVVRYSCVSEVQLYPGPSAETVLTQIQAAFKNYRTQSEKIGHYIADSGIKAALHQAGVYRARVVSPDLPVEISENQAPFCDSFVVDPVETIGVDNV